MKKLIFTIVCAFALVACGGMKVYNNGLKELEARSDKGLGMSKEEVVALMGDKFTTSGQQQSTGTTFETIEYQDMYKNKFIFNFENNKLVKWLPELKDKK